MIFHYKSSASGNDTFGIVEHLPFGNQQQYILLKRVEI